MAEWWVLFRALVVACFCVCLGGGGGGRGVRGDPERERERCVSNVSPVVSAL